RRLPRPGSPSARCPPSGPSTIHRHGHPCPPDRRQSGASGRTIRSQANVSSNTPGRVLDATVRPGDAETLRDDGRFTRTHQHEAKESIPMTSGRQKLIYTLTDEAPRLATEAFLPVVSTFADAAGIDVTTSDISVAARILAAFPDRLTDEQKVPDNLAELGALTQDPDTNIIKLPNISASVPQLNTAIAELREKGYDVPYYPQDPKTPEELEIAERYGSCLGSAVNPVLRQGNSDRRAPKAVKEYARANPHSMGKWSMASQSHVAHMIEGDFYAGEKSIILDHACDARMEVQTPDGETHVLKTVSLEKGEVIDSMFMSKKALLDFYEEQLNDAKDTGVMFSLHVKATMMKVSHPIVFGHAVRVFYREAFAKHDQLFEELGINVNNGMVDLYEKIDTLPTSKKEEIIEDLHRCHEHRPELAMVDSA